MAFSKGKRIEDETSTRILDLAVRIGCSEGADALTVTRLCRELNFDRRVIYNRFRDINEINMLVAARCNEELIKKADEAVSNGASFADLFIARITTVFAYICEKNIHFQRYAQMYEVTEDGVQNGFLQYLEGIIDGCAAEGIWLILMGESSLVLQNSGRKYQDALETLIYSAGVFLGKERV